MHQIAYENVVLVGIITEAQDEVISKEYLEELAFLSYTSGGKVVAQFTQKIETPDPKTFVRLGKIEEILQCVSEKAVSAVIFDDELSPSQQKNIEKLLRCKVVDRTGLILDIFAQRAKTSYAATQVELAQYQYLLPRLTGLWTHLERQKGGIGMRGPGEREIETDRRIVRDRISLLKDKLAAIDRQMKTQRSNRGALVRVALVGYTNVGKSTLMNVISKTQVFAEDKLFATLDTTIRKVVIGNLPFLIGDTVGFIRKLPTQLIAAFKSTLDEVKEADLLLHVVDISHPNFEKQMTSVNQILSDIGCIDKPTVLVFNKIDRYNQVAYDQTDLTHERQPKNFTLEEWKDTWMRRSQDHAVFISALNKQNLEDFRKIVYQTVRDIHITRFPYNNFLYEDYTEDDVDSESVEP